VKSGERVFVWECKCDWSAGEVNERERGLGGVESVRPADDQFDLVVHRFCPSVAQVQPAGCEDPVAVLADRFAQPDERL
jgi:hypothetical protein